MISLQNVLNIIQKYRCIVLIPLGVASISDRACEAGELALTRRPERLSLPRELELVLHRLLEGRLCASWRAPNLQLHMLGAVQPVHEEHRGEVDI